MDFKVVNGVNISTCEIKFGIILKFVVINKKNIVYSELDKMSKMPKPVVELSGRL